MRNVAHTLTGIIEDRERLRRAAAAVLITAGLTALTVAGAAMRFRLPGQPVPFTMQVYAVLFAGLAGGLAKGAASQLLYLGLGAAGLPVFAAGMGLVGPTGGYLVGFAAAAALSGMMAGDGRGGMGRLFAAALLGLGAIYLFGVVHLVLVWGVSAGEALRVGVVPFLPFDLLKAALAAASAQVLRRGRR